MNIPHDQQARLRQLEELHKNEDVVGCENAPETLEEIFNVPPKETDDDDIL